jgi:exoribonuclease R
MITINSQEEYDSAKNRYEEAIQKSCQWEYDLEKKYNEDQQIDIMGMIAYWENQLRGFGKQNDERLYESIRKEDSSGHLLEEAKKGFEYAKVCLELGSPVIKWEIANKKNRRFKYAKV